MSTEALQTKFEKLVTFVKTLDLKEDQLCLMLGNLLIGYVTTELEGIEKLIDDASFPLENKEDYEKVYLWLESYPRSPTAIVASTGHQLLALSHVVQLGKEVYYEQ